MYKYAYRVVRRFHDRYDFPQTTVLYENFHCPKEARDQLVAMSGQNQGDKLYVEKYMLGGYDAK